MTVLYYQIAIVVSLVVSRIFGHRVYYAILVLWLLWTFAMLTAGSPLFLFQMGTIGATFLAISKFYDQKEKVRGLEQSISNLSAVHKDKIQNIMRDKINPLSTNEHYEFLLAKIGAAESEIIILSGWIGAQVVDDKFAKILQKTLKQGVSIYVGFGYESRGKHELGPSAATALATLQGLSNDFPSQLYVGRFANHEKVLIVDTSAVVYGSANWLNNRSYKNSESSVIINDPNLAREESVRIKMLIMGNLI